MADFPRSAECSSKLGELFSQGGILMSTSTAPVQLLAELQPKHKFFIGIDSDGCAFDTMEIKHKECFCPNFIEKFECQAISKYTREAWEFVNLYSKWRGCNRWEAVIRVLTLLHERPEVKR